MVWRGDLGYSLNGMTITLAPKENDGPQQVSRQEEYQQQVNHQQVNHQQAPYGSMQRNNSGKPPYAEDNIYDTSTDSAVTPDEWDPVNPFSNANAAAMGAARSPPPEYRGKDNAYAPPGYSQFDDPARANPNGTQTYTHRVADRYRYSLAQKEEAILYEPHRGSEARWDNLNQRDPSVLVESRQVRKYRKSAQKQQQQQQQQQQDDIRRQRSHQSLADEDVVVSRPDGNSLRPDVGEASGYYAGDRRSMNFIGGRNVGTLDI